MSFTATRWPKPRWTADQTLPIPPRPIRPSIRYFPAITVPVRVDGKSRSSSPWVGFTTYRAFNQPRGAVKTLCPEHPFDERRLFDDGAIRIFFDFGPRLGGLVDKDEICARRLVRFHLDFALLCDIGDPEI